MSTVAVEGRTRSARLLGIEICMPEVDSLLHIDKFRPCVSFCLILALPPLLSIVVLLLPDGIRMHHLTYPCLVLNSRIMLCFPAVGTTIIIAGQSGVSERFECQSTRKVSRCSHERRAPAAARVNMETFGIPCSFPRHFSPGATTLEWRKAWIGRWLAQRRRLQAEVSGRNSPPIVVLDQRRDFTQCSRRDTRTGLAAAAYSAKDSQR